MPLTALSNWLMRTTKAWTDRRQRTHCCTWIHFFTNAIANDRYFIFMYMGALALKELTLLHTICK